MERGWEETVAVRAEMRGSQSMNAFWWVIEAALRFGH